MDCSTFGICGFVQWRPNAYPAAKAHPTTRNRSKANIVDCLSRIWRELLWFWVSVSESPSSFFSLNWQRGILDVDQLHCNKHWQVAVDITASIDFNWLGNCVGKTKSFAWAVLVCLQIWQFKVKFPSVTSYFALSPRQLTKSSNVTFKKLMLKKLNSQDFLPDVLEASSPSPHAEMTLNSHVITLNVTIFIPLELSLLLWNWHSLQFCNTNYPW